MRLTQSVAICGECDVLLVSLWQYRLLGLPASLWSGSAVGVGGRPAIGR